MEANEAKADNLAQTVIGNDEKQMQGYRERLEIREVLDTRCPASNGAVLRQFHAPDTSEVIVRYTPPTYSTPVCKTVGFSR